MDIDDDGLLGVDILKNGKNGPSDLLMSKGVLFIDKKEVPIIQVGVKSRVRKVTAADHFVTPAQSECIIDVYLERHEYDDFSSEKDFIVEPTEHFQAEYPLQMASTLVDINQTCTGKVRVLNPFPTTMSIKQDAVIEKAEAIDSEPYISVREEDASEVANQATIGRVKFFNEDCSSPITDNSARKTHVVSPEIQIHLNDLYQKTAENLDTDQKLRVVQLLHRFQDTFSRDEWDLGLTHCTPLKLTVQHRSSSHQGEWHMRRKRRGQLRI